MSDDGRDRSREGRDRSRRDRSRFSENSRDRDRSPDKDRRSMKSSNNRVYVSNIPYEYRWQDMKDLFRNEVGDVQFVELFLDDNDKPKGCGIVEFADSSSVKKCLEVMQRYDVKGRKLVIKDDSGNTRDKHGNLVGGGNKRSRDDRYNRDDRRGHGNSISLQGGSGDDGKWGNTYGLSPHFLESLNIDAPLSNRVFVANLDYTIDKKKLKDVFRLAGHVIRVDVPLDKDGRIRGFAVIEYDHPVEAVQAISMLHNQVLYDRTMTVRMDRANETLKLPEGLKGIGMGLGQNGEPLRNVAHNLPNSQSQTSSIGAGILGAVPNNALQAAAALTGFNNVSALTNLNPSVLQAANLSGLAGNLLQNSLNGADLSSLVNTSTLMQNQATQQQLAALAASSNTGGANVGQSHLSSAASSLQPFGTRDTQGFSTTQPVSYPQTQNYGSSLARGYQATDNRNAVSLRSSSMDDGKYSRKVLVSNIPSTANYKMLQDKFNEFGDVSFCEEKAPGSFLIVYGSEWQAERAIKNLDKARVDGRFIEARFYY